MSGVQAHTIRIWEQRYNLLVPNRSDTNIRSYSDYYARKLLNVVALVGNGWKISKVAKLSHDDIGNEIQKIIEFHDSGHGIDLVLVNQIIQSGVLLSEAAFDKAFSSSLLKYGVKESYLKVIYPTLVKIGLMWSKDGFVPVQEHFITSLIKQKLFSAIDALPYNHNNSENWVLFLPEGEHHELGLLMANYVLKERGVKVVYLGSNVPFDHVEEVLVKHDVSHLLLFAIAKETVSKITELIDRLTDVVYQSELWIAGSFDEDVKSLNAGKAKFIRSFDDFIKIK